MSVRAHLSAPLTSSAVGRWQKNRDLSWYARSDATATDADAAELARKARAEEIARIKEAEQDALSQALGLPPGMRSAIVGNTSLETGGSGANGTALIKNRMAIPAQVESEKGQRERYEMTRSRGERKSRANDEHEGRHQRRRNDPARSRSRSASRNRTSEKHRRRERRRLSSRDEKHHRRNISPRRGTYPSHSEHQDDRPQQRRRSFSPSVSPSRSRSPRRASQRYDRRTSRSRRRSTPPRAYSPKRDSSNQQISGRHGRLEETSRIHDQRYEERDGRNRHR